jgi:uncharacterized protein
VILGVPIGELVLLAGAIVVGGMITGLLAGIFGIGGGAITVPVLYEIFRVLGVTEDIRTQLCVGTALAIIVPTSIRSFLARRAICQLAFCVCGPCQSLWGLPPAD